MALSASSQMPAIRLNGLTILAGSDPGQSSIDIVFVHGLNGHPETTWKFAKSDFFWPWELRMIIPQARIMTFGYDARIETSLKKNMMGIHDHGISLLTRLRNERPPSTTTKRPIVFVCHSLGGLVVKEALISGATDPNYAAVYHATASVFFFGTPHRGAAALSTKRLAVLLKLAKLTFTQIPANIEHSLRGRADELFSINDRFRNISLLQDALLSITCFYERVETTGLGDCIVDQDSAVLGYTGEEDVGLPVDHKGLVRFSGVEDDNYDMVSKTIRYKLQGILELSKADQDLQSISPSFKRRIYIRPQQMLPYLPWKNWDPAFIELCAKWGGPTVMGTERLGRHVQTWMNLLVAFGAQCILGSKHVEELPVNPDDLPIGVSDPFATQLKCAALLAGLIGCDTVVEDDGGGLSFTCETASLAFIPGGVLPYKVGKFLQQPSLPTFLLMSAKSIGLAASLSDGAFWYGRKPLQIAADHQFKHLRPWKDLFDFRCKCEYSYASTLTGLQKSHTTALGLLVGDTPVTARVFPSQKAGLLEAAQAMVSYCGFWRSHDLRTTISMVQGLPIGGGIAILFSEDEFLKIPFFADRVEQRAILMVHGNLGLHPRYIDLGYSWLASMNDYESPFPQPEVRVKARPQWHLQCRNDDLIVLDGMVEACRQFLDGKEYVWPGSLERKSYFGTSLSCQLQEVDWWLGQRKKIASCEALNLIETLHGFGSADPVGDRAATRTVLIFRALLFAMLLGMALDNSRFVQTELGDEIVLIR